MDKSESEMRYLSVEAHMVLDFLSSLRQSQRTVALVPNLRYGLVALSPILPILRKEQYALYPVKVGSSEAHDKPLVMGRQASLPLELITQDQPHFVVVDGTRNIGGNTGENHKYPDSHQGYLNYTVVLNDCITSEDAKSFAPLMGVSLDHIWRLRDTEQYWAHRSQLEERVREAKINMPYSFKYWNPAGLTLALLNHGKDCISHAESFSPTKENSSTPAVFFVNSVMPSKYHSGKHKGLWGDHHPAYFDDNYTASNFKFDYDKCGVHVISGLGKDIERIYEEIYKEGDLPNEKG